MRETEEGGGARRVREGARGCVAMLEGSWRRGGSRRWPGKQEVAEAASAPVGHARCLLARGRRQGGSGDGLGRKCWAVQVGFGERQVSPGKFLFFYCFSVSVLYFATVFFKLKQIQNSARYPLNNLCC